MNKSNNQKKLKLSKKNKLPWWLNVCGSRHNLCSIVSSLFNQHCDDCAYADHILWWFSSLFNQCCDACAYMLIIIQCNNDFDHHDGDLMIINRMNIHVWIFTSRVITHAAWFWIWRWWWIWSRIWRWWWWLDDHKQDDLWIFTSRVITQAAIIKKPEYRKSQIHFFTTWFICNFAIVLQLYWWIINSCFGSTVAFSQIVLENNLFNVNTGMETMT